MAFVHTRERWAEGRERLKMKTDAPEGSGGNQFSTSVDGTWRSRNRRKARENIKLFGVAFCSFSKTMPTTLKSLAR